MRSILRHETLGFVAAPFQSHSRLPARRPVVPATYVLSGFGQGLLLAWLANRLVPSA